MPVPGLFRAALVAVALLVGCGDDDEATTTTDASPTTTSGNATTTTTDNTATTRTVPIDDVISIDIASGAVAGGVHRARVAAGEEVTLRITIDVDDEVHVHGYNIEAPLPVGQATDVTFVADLPGVWEVELHDAGIPILELEVS